MNSNKETVAESLPARTHARRQAILLAAVCAASLSSFAATAPLAFPAAAAPAGCAPLKGLVLWPDNADDLSGAISLEFSYCLPCDVATGTNANGSVIYDWSKIDNLLSDIASRKHQAILRFRYAYPGEKLNGVRGATAVPKFIKDRDDYHESYATNPGGDGPTYYPDWSCKALEDFTLEFYRKFASRYDKDPRLAFLQVGFGHWAEYHIYDTPVALGTNFPTRVFQERFFRQMSETMRLTPWMVSIDSAARNTDNTPAVALNDEGVRFGLFDDSFMCEEHEIGSGDGDNEKNWNAFGADHWKRSPHGGEISYYDEGDQHNFLGPNGIYGVTWAQAAAKYHMTFVIANDATEGAYADSEHFLQAQADCGYKLEVASAAETSGGLRVVVRNSGVAPFYFPATLSYGGRRAAGTLKGILPSETREFVVPGARSGAKLEVVSPKFLGATPVPGLTLKLK